MKDKYIKYENAGDQFLGRTIAGLPITNKEFGIVAPHFDFSSIESNVEKFQAEVAVDKWISEQMPVAEVEAQSKSIFYLFKMSLASFTYHFDFLEAHLHTDCAIRYSDFFSELVPHGNCVRVAFPWDKSKDTPEITGIPPHTVLLSEIKELKEMVTVLQLQISICCSYVFIINIISL